MSLNKWLLGKEGKVILSKIHKEVIKAFLTKKGQEFKYKKRYWIETLINLVAERLNMKKDIVRKGIDVLIAKSILYKNITDTITYGHPFSEKDIAGYLVMQKIYEENFGGD